MKATIGSGILEKELKVLSPVIRKNHIIPITGGVKFEFTKNKVKITASNLETTVSSFFECQCKDEFSVVLSFDDIFKFISKINAPVTIEESNNTIIVKSDPHVFKFSKLGDAKDFPRTPDDEMDFVCDVEGDFFFTLTNANACKNENELMVNSNMACGNFKKDVIDLVGTNMNCCYYGKVAVKCEKEFRIMIPESFVSIVKSFQASNIFINEKRIKAEFGNRSVISLLGEQKFVSYETGFNREIIYNLTVDKAELKKHLDIVGVAADITTLMCTITFGKDKITITSQSLEYEKEAETVVSVKHTVPFDKICINGGQMMKLLNLITSPEIEMSFEAPNKTIYLRPTDDEPVSCLLQPLYIKN